VTDMPSGLGVTPPPSIWATIYVATFDVFRGTRGRIT
jgi:hypothetical protein